MNDLVYFINKDYSQDVKNINEWYAREMEKSEQQKNFYVIVNSEVLSEIRASIGLQEDIEFMEDIYDHVDLTFDYISLIRISPGTATGPSITKIRKKSYDKSVDQLFDPSLPNRNCTLVIPLQGFDDSANINWISKRLVLSDKDISRKNFDDHIVEVTKIGQTPFLMRADQAIQYTNLQNPNYFYFLQIGFEQNPTYEEVKYKFYKFINR